ncbi:catechol-2,3-dioxygenase [Staphylococcus hominis]
MGRRIQNEVCPILIYQGGNMINRGINHIGLTVPNIEEAMTFFKQGLDGKIAKDCI